MSADLTVSGLRELRRALGLLARDGGALCAPAVSRALAPLAARVEADAPVDTGALAHSVTTREHPPRNGRVRGEVVVEARYAAAVDLGTHEMEADDFLQRAFDEESKQAADRAEATIVRAIQDSL